MIPHAKAAEKTETAKKQRTRKNNKPKKARPLTTKLHRSRKVNRTERIFLARKNEYQKQWDTQRKRGSWTIGESVRFLLSPFLNPFESIRFVLSPIFLNPSAKSAL
jgi:hypothetical protein